MKFAPIVLFVYNRPYHTTEVLKSLSKCFYANYTDLFIFSDAPKNECSTKKVSEVRRIINSEEWLLSFASVTVIEATTNKGLANSVISGVTEVIERYKRVIVLEDDNRVAIDFIDYMDRALDYYQDNDTIGSIGAYTLPIEIPKSYKADVFLMGRGSSYAWATWSRFWSLIDWDVKDYPSFKHNVFQRIKFNEYGKDRSNMLDRQMKGEIDSWAIRYSYALFKNNLNTILPTKTRVENIGNDGSGTHFTSTESRYSTHIESNLKPVVFEQVSINPKLKKEYAHFFYSSNIFTRIIHRIGRCFSHKS